MTEKRRRFSRCFLSGDVRPYPRNPRQNILDQCLQITRVCIFTYLLRAVCYEQEIDPRHSINTRTRVQYEILHLLISKSIIPITQVSMEMLLLKRINIEQVDLSSQRFIRSIDTPQGDLLVKLYFVAAIGFLVFRSQR